MPKAPRDKESAAPKKKARKGVSASSNGAHAENGNGAATAPATVPTETAVAPQVSSVQATEAAPNIEEQIRQRAYELYLQRGGHGGSPEQDWLRAVEEIRGQQRTA